MKTKPKKHLPGFTLSELLVAMAVGLLVINALWIIYLVSNKSFKSGSNKYEVAQNAKIALEKMSRELRETNEIISVLPPDASSPADKITFRDANYAKIRYITYHLSGTDLNRRLTHYYLSNPDDWVISTTPEATLVTDEDIPIATNLTNIKFYGQSLITIEISGQVSSEKIDLTTNVKPRNI